MTLDKKKPQRRRKARPASPQTAPAPAQASAPPNVEIEYIVDDGVLKHVEDDALKAAFERMMGAGGAEAGNGSLDTPVAGVDVPDSEAQAPSAPILDAEGNVVSKSMLRRLHRPTVAQLKQSVSRPGIVEVVDTTASDPELLIFLKGLRAAVPVPRHWQTSTKFLSGKRGSERIKYELPEYIANTGISKLRDASDTNAADLKAQMRERVRPKMGRMDIDYQVLHDAFFKLQTMPRLTRHGELYYEGKEFEKDPSKFVPGVLSDELRKALGMPTVERDGAAAVLVPPPWLNNMQRVGPPPSYPGAQFPGVNAPIPVGAHYGMHSGGWGKPPVDQFGRSLYGDVFGVALQHKVDTEKHIDKKFKWGGFSREDVDETPAMSRRPDEEEEEEEEVEEGGEDADMGDQPVVVVSLSEQNNGLSIVEAPLDAPVDLRKRAAATVAAAPPPPPPATTAANISSMAHKILEMATVSATEKGLLFGASHTYVAASDATAAAASAPQPTPAAPPIAKPNQPPPPPPPPPSAAAAAKKKAFKF